MLLALTQHIALPLSSPVHQVIPFPALMLCPEARHTSSILLSNFHSQIRAAHQLKPKQLDTMVYMDRI